MAFKFGKALIRKYSEIGQPNPLRWEILYQDEKGVFQPQTGKMKCKDFFNDLVSKIMANHDVYIYGFNTATCQVNETGVWFRLSNVEDQKQFINNANNVINPLLSEQQCTTISLYRLPRNKVLVFIPKIVFTSTYYVSLITYLLRLCNYGQELKSFHDALNHNVTSIDNALNANALSLARQWEFKVPEKFSKYWYYAGDHYNNVTISTPISASVVHNNGVCQWAYYTR